MLGPPSGRGPLQPWTYKYFLSYYLFTSRTEIISEHQTEAFKDSTSGLMLENDLNMKLILINRIL